MRTPSEVVTEGGSRLRLPPGRFVDDLGWSALDAEMRRLQDAETRLKAERDAYAKEPKSPPVVVIAAVVLGVLIGGGSVWYVTR